MSKNNEAKEKVKIARELGHVFVKDIPEEENWPHKVSISLDWNGCHYVLHWQENGHDYEENVKKSDAIKYIVDILEGVDEQ